MWNISRRAVCPVGSHVTTLFISPIRLPLTQLLTFYTFGLLIHQYNWFHFKLRGQWKQILWFYFYTDLEIRRINFVEWPIQTSNLLDEIFGVVLCFLGSEKNTTSTYSFQWHLLFETVSGISVTLIVQIRLLQIAIYTNKCYLVVGFAIIFRKSVTCNAKGVGHYFYGKYHHF